RKVRPVSLQVCTSADTIRKCATFVESVTFLRPAKLRTRAQVPRMRTLIVMPAFNEEEALPKTMAALSRLPAGFDVLIVNDGSTDRTGAVAEQLAATSPIPVYVVNLPVNCGIGGAVQTGYRFALERGEYRHVIQFDADGQHDENALVPMVERCERERLDLCI